MPDTVKEVIYPFPQVEKNGLNQKAVQVLKFKKRMLEWPNPVEYVNNMYGCHPDDKNTDYFKVVFGKWKPDNNGEWTRLISDNHSYRSTTNRITSSI